MRSLVAQGCLVGPAQCATGSLAYLMPAPVLHDHAHMLQVHHRIVESLLQLLEAERSGEAVNRYLLKRAVDMLSNLRLYEDGVQETLLASAAEYYSREGSALINVRPGSRRGPSLASLVDAFSFF